LSGALSAPSDREAILRMLVRIKQPEAVNLHPEEAGASGVLAGAVARVAGAVRHAAGALAVAGWSSRRRRKEELQPCGERVDRWAQCARAAVQTSDCG